MTLAQEIERPSLKRRIDRILGRNCPALGGVSAEAIGVIRELEERLAVAGQALAFVRHRDSRWRDDDAVPPALAACDLTKPLAAPQPKSKKD